MRILITGGAGFIGSHLVGRLLSDGAEVVVLDDMSTGRESNLAPWLSSSAPLSLVRGSVLDQDLVHRLIASVDTVVHLAAAVGVKLIMESPTQSILTNVTGTENVLRAAAERGCRFLLSSTSEVYGKGASDAFSEGDDLTIGATVNLRWSYACSKALDEFMTLALVQERALPATVVRLFNTSGPRQTGRYGMVLPRFVRAACAGEPLVLHGDGLQSRCFCHVRDVVEALTRLLRTDAAIGKVVNIGTREEITIRALAESVKRAVGSNSQIQTVPYAEVYGAGFEDMQRRVPDVSKLERLIGFRPQTPLSQIIEDIITDVRGERPHV